MDINEFPSGMIEHLGWYVYRLIDPRDGSTFYVGKGKGNRVFAHMRGEVAAADDDELLSNKLKQLREIRLAGLEVIHVIHRHGIRLFLIMTGAYSGSGSRACFFCVDLNFLA